MNPYYLLNGSVNKVNVDFMSSYRDTEALWTITGAAHLLWATSTFQIMNQISATSCLKGTVFLQFALKLSVQKSRTVWISACQHNRMFKWHLVYHIIHSYSTFQSVCVVLEYSLPIKDIFSNSLPETSNMQLHNKHSLSVR